MWGCLERGVCEPLGELERRGEQQGWGWGVPPAHPELSAPRRAWEWGG